MDMQKIRGNEEGTILVLVLIILVLLTGIGISGSVTSGVEVQIAGNEKFSKMAFYAADGGTEVGVELLEQNIETRGFSNASVGTTTVHELDLFANLQSGITTENVPSDTNRDVTVPNIANGNVYLKIFGNTELSTGNALQIAAGYEGKGKGVAGGGAYVVYDIRACAIGTTRSRSMVYLQWAHMI